MNALRPITLNGGLEEVIITSEAPSKIREIAIRSFKLYFPINLLTPHIDRRALVVYRPIDFKKIALRLIDIAKKIAKIKDELINIRAMSKFSHKSVQLFLRLRDISSQFKSLNKHEVSRDDHRLIWCEIIVLSCELRDTPTRKEYQGLEHRTYQILTPICEGLSCSCGVNVSYRKRHLGL